jgi:hypothetical protein
LMIASIFFMPIGPACTAHQSNIPPRGPPRRFVGFAGEFAYYIGKQCTSCQRLAPM